jgi:diguanylate cyclase (GGDEF)-like protein
VNIYLPSNFSGIIIITLILLYIIGGIIIGKLVQRLHSCSSSDSLTGLKSRGYFYLRLSEEIKKMKKQKSPISLLLIDIDNFKSINDRFGHIISDNVLVEMANIFLGNARNIDTIVRWGGEEFAIILPNTSYLEAHRVGEKIRQSVEGHSFFTENSRFNITISIGICSTDKEIGIDQFINNTDKALYKAKEKKNVVEDCRNVKSVIVYS